MGLAGEYNLHYWWDGQSGQSPDCKLVIDANHTFSVVYSWGTAYTGKWMEMFYHMHGFYPPVLRLNTASCTTYVTEWFGGSPTDPTWIGGGMTNYVIKGRWLAERIAVGEERDKKKLVLDANGVELTPENK